MKYISCPFICSLRFQDLPQLDQLQQQFSDKAHLEPHNCLFKDSSIKNVVPDPDLPQGCDADSPEYDPL